MRSLFLLLRRNCLKRMRSPCASCVEFSFPILVVGLFILMFSAFTPSDVATSQYIGNTNTISSLVGAPLRLLDINARIAIGERCLSSVGVHPHPAFLVSRSSFFYA